jgi:hypothetical protein
MTETQPAPMLLIASDDELAWSRPAWGTGGWMAPEQREALDWLTLARLMGWGVNVASSTDFLVDGDRTAASRWIVIGRDPESCGDELVSHLSARLAAERLLVVTRASQSDNKFSRLAGARSSQRSVSGRSLSWTGAGPERTWQCRNVLEFKGLELDDDAQVWAKLDDVPVITARRVGQGMIATLGFHPSAARDLDGAVTALLHHLLVWGALEPIAWFDFENTVVLRMDDPGGAQNVFNRTFYYPKLNEAQWAAIGNDLQQRQARLSMAYVSGWVDDGDLKRGVLRIGGQETPRIPGKVYPSPQVHYEDRGGHAPGTIHDYEAEFRGIQRLRSDRLGDVELHGNTHIHPDRQRWLSTDDRYETWPSTCWFRELGEPAATALAALPPEEHPLVLGVAALGEHFGIRPTTLIPPGDQWTNEVLEIALDLGMILVDSYYLAIRDTDRFCWCTHVCSPYLDKPDAAWFDSGLPVVGYFHDYEPAVYGVEWISKWLDRWQELGARRFIDFRELAAIVSRQLVLEKHDGLLSLTINDGHAPALVRPVAVNIRVPEGKVPPNVSATIDSTKISLQVNPLGDTVGRVALPVSH